MADQLDDIVARGGRLDRALGSARVELLPEELDEGEAQIGAEVDRILGLTERQERLAAVAGLLSGRLRPILNALWRFRQDEAEALLTRLSAGPGLSSHVSKLRARLAQAAKAAAAGLQVFGPGEGVSPVFRATIGGRQVILDVPQGWTCSEGGVHRLVQVRGLDGPQVEQRHVSHHPIILTRRFEEAGSAVGEFVEVAWNRGGAWQTRRVDRGAITRAKDLAHIDGRAPVTSETAGQLVTFLAALEACNDLPSGWVSTHMGWQGRQRSHFLIGRQLIAPDGGTQIELMDELDPGLRSLANAARPRGSWEGWLDALAPVRAQPLAWVAVYASCASVLLELVGCPGFMCDFNAPDGLGKSSVLQLAASVWGDPREGEGLARSWAGTVAGHEGYASSMHSLPILLDESNKIVERDRHNIGSLIFMFCNGSGKLRGTVQPGSTRAPTAWHAVSISTGEQSITAYDQNGGTKARCLPLPGAPLASARQSEDLRADLEANHGHLGPRFVRHLVDLGPEGAAKLHAEYRQRVQDIGAEMTTRAARRMAQYIATLDIAARIIHGQLGVPRPAVDVFQFVVELADGESQAADRPAAALRKLASFVFAQPGLMATWGGRGDDRGRSKPDGPAWLGRYSDNGDDWEWLALYTHVVHDFLSRSGFEPGAMLAEWEARGWLASNTSRTKPLTMPGTCVKTRMYALKRSAFEKVGAMGGPDD